MKEKVARIANHDPRALGTGLVVWFFANTTINALCWWLGVWGKPPVTVQVAAVVAAITFLVIVAAYVSSVLDDRAMTRKVKEDQDRASEH